MKPIYHTHIVPETNQIISLYNSSGINRPTQDVVRIEKMYLNSNLVISAWNEDQLIGIARSLTDFCYSCYLSDLAVRQEFKNKGIGKELIALTRKSIGNQSSLILLSASAAMDYYPKAGFEKIQNGFIIPRLE